MREIWILLGTVSLAIVVQLNNASAASVLFKDRFTSFTLGTLWDTPAFLNTNNISYTYLGAPNVLLEKTANGLRMTSAQPNYETTGIASRNTFSITSGSVSTEFITGDFMDSKLVLPPGTSDENIDGVIALELINPTTGDYFVAQLFGGYFGTDRQFRIASSLEPPTFSAGPQDWQYGEVYQIFFKSGAKSTDVMFEDFLGHVLFEHRLPAGLSYLGQFYIVLAQWMGIPGSPYYNDVYVRQVEVIQN